MKSLKITLTAAFVVLMIVAKAANVGSTYSHLPLNLKEALVEKFNQFEPAANEPMNGNIWIEFHLNENQEICITKLSSDDIDLGTFVRTVLQEIPKMNVSGPVGKTYYVKVRLNYE
ncbi:MAG TPA: hypothetical protein DCQ26_07615 [Marinilabiliales bacterium]|jgi:hypothetical protein|nr:MAG: hypothetical protein A2W95_00705 [Bacteroidetes bacterium GWA2_40_14]OFX64538.1 MAG: hypothetical protein A2W84_01420 [Bacteroidetes bacterium GWC2_40_13]OFX71900.1 MAG: hypothetical protein A2W96_06620 [Bacteroidetes bacterium GWD2_40_43]OFX94697.1 MAG: hypothetical protein A2W97_18425 [Bacteroidetes bacterium GWE2_40_63]OFY24774.1 MAG: hypothetical protein A2W88_16890 [Bacteroidetes bacterium GWF2_40_13]OFZ24463.1 MAG: hypothetical protein A2437_18560 [Bacteroidetes bacterium RIFOXYC